MRIGLVVLVCGVLAGCSASPRLAPLGQTEPSVTVPVAADVKPPEPVAAPKVTMAPAPKGFLSRFRASGAKPNNPDPVQAQAATPVPVAAAPSKVRRGLFAGLAGPRVQDASAITPQVPLTFGAVQKACNVPRSGLGKSIERYMGYTIYDSDPGSSSQRAFYITGFQDKCPRKVLGSLVIFGNSQGHEILRYSRKGSYSEFDKTYETIKSRVCRVGRGKPCTSRRAALDRQLTFLTVYQTFGASNGTSTLLFHKGKVVAKT